MISPRRRAVFAAVLVAVVLAIIEIGSYPVARFLARKGVLYDAAVRADDYTRYLEIRDPLLGWPSPTEDRLNRDATGARHSPAFPDQASPACVSLYGDSFTWGDDVDDEQAWGNLLSRHIGCRVSNFGVGGYGTDQAVLRHRENGRDRAPVTILGYQPENVLRNVNQYRALLFAGAVMGFKPRFVIGASGQLELIRIPAIPTDAYDSFLASPGRFLEHEYFLPGGSAGISRLGFPYSLKVLRSFRHFHVRSRFRRVPWYAEFYRLDHESRGLEVTLGLVSRFIKQARDRGQSPVVIVLPDGRGLQYRIDSNQWAFEPFLELAASSGLEIHNLGEDFLERLDGADPCSLFHDCSGHYNKHGYRMVAELVAKIVGPAVESKRIRAR